jgi:membrane protein implicated in regulation of membrane protease activity
MCFFIVIGLILILIGLVMLLTFWPTWPMGVTLIGVGLVVVAFFGWAYRRIFTEQKGIHRQD